MLRSGCGISRATELSCALSINPCSGSIDLPSLQINGEKIGKGRFSVLREGNEIAFGTAQPQPGSLEDYRMSLSRDSLCR